MSIPQSKNVTREEFWSEINLRRLELIQKHKTEGLKVMEASELLHLERQYDYFKEIALKSQ